MPDSAWKGESLGS